MFNKEIQSFLDKDYHQLIVANLFVLTVSLVIIKFGSALFV